jgi:type IV pilus assembly protein PilA
VIQKIKNRMASEQGFTLIELLVVIIILGVLVAIAVPSYLSFRGKAEVAAAKANVRSAIPAAENYYSETVANGGGGNSYAGITGAKIRTLVAGVSLNVKAGAAGTTYCLEDTEGSTTYSYEGGTGGASAIVSGVCPVATYTGASAVA